MSNPDVAPFAPPGWREVQDGGRSLLEVRLAADAVDSAALIAYAAASHPLLLPLESLTSEDGTLRLRLGPTGTGPAVLPPPREAAARATLAALLGHGAPAFAVASRLGRPVLAPQPEAFRPGPRAAQPPPCAPAGPAGTGLRFTGREDLLDSLARKVARLAGSPRFVLVQGARGSGRSALLHQLGVRLALAGARVATGLPAAAGPPGKFDVVLIDDADRHPAVLDRLLAWGEWAAHPALVVLACDDGFAPEAAMERVALAPLAPDELAAAAFVPGLDPDRLGEAARRAASGSGGSPSRFRLRLAAAARGLEAGQDEAALAALAAALPLAGRKALAVALALDRELTPATLEAALGRAADFGPLEELIVETGWGLALPPPGAAAAALAAAGLDARRVHLAATRGLAGRAGAVLARASHLLAAGEGEQAGRLLVAAAESARPEQALDLAERAGACRLEPHAAWAAARSRERAGSLAAAARSWAALAARTADSPASRALRVRAAGCWARLGEIDRAASELALARGPLDDRDEVRRTLVEAHLAYRAGAVAAARKRYEEVLARPALADDERGEALSGLGYLLCRGPGGSRRGERLLGQARALQHGPERRADLSRTLSRLANARARRGDLAAAEQLQLEALDAALAAGDRGGVAECRVDLASTAFDLGQLARAERLLETARAGFERLGDARAAHLAGVNLAALSCELGRPLESVPVLEAGLAADRAAGRRWDEAHDLRFLGLAAAALGQLEAAGRHLAEAEAAFRALEDEDGLAEVFLAGARLALDRRDGAEAVERAESGLRALAGRRPNPTRLSLRLVLAEARLEIDPSAGGGREIEAALAGAAAAPDPSRRAEGARLALLVAACRGSAALAPAVERAVAAGEAQERPDVLARTLLVALERASSALDRTTRAALLARLRELHRGPGRAARLEALGVRETPAAVPQPEALAEDSLLRLEEILAAEAPRAGAVLELVARRVALHGAALLEDDGRGRLAVRAVLGTTAGKGAGLERAVSLAEKARLVGEPVSGKEEPPEPPAEAGGKGNGRAGAGPVAAAALGAVGVAAERAAGEPPFAFNELRFLAAVARRLAAAPALVRPGPDGAPEDGADDLGILGRSPAVLRLREEIALLAAADIPVFLHGESGTGKELAARALHARSARSSGPFVAVNCAALPESLLESELFGHVRGAFSGAVSDREGLIARADRGILLLDEVAELSPALQAKLLRVVELGEYRPVGTTRLRTADVRFLSATHRDVARAVREGRFREDLYWRLLATATIELPPLRERAGDVALLAAHFARRFAARSGGPPPVFAPAALRLLEEWPFPGNVRELERLVQGLAARAAGRRIEIADVERALTGRAPLGRAGEHGATLAEARRGFEQRWLVGLLERHAGNRTRAARSAGVARQTLLALLRRHGLDATGHAGAGAVHERGIAGSAAHPSQTKRAAPPPWRTRPVD